MKRELKVSHLTFCSSSHLSRESHEERIERTYTTSGNKKVPKESHEERIESRKTKSKRTLWQVLQNLMKRELKVDRSGADPWPRWWPRPNLMKRELKVSRGIGRCRAPTPGISWRENWKLSGTVVLSSALLGISWRENWKLRHVVRLHPRDRNLMKRELKDLKLASSQYMVDGESHEERIESWQELWHRQFRRANLMKRELKDSSVVSISTSGSPESHEERIES